MGSLVRRFRKWWEGYLNRVTRANKESFGGGRMDCCGLGKSGGTRKPG